MQRIILRITDFDDPRLTFDESGENKEAPRACEALQKAVAEGNN